MIRKYLKGQHFAYCYGKRGRWTRLCAGVYNWWLDFRYKGGKRAWIDAESEKPPRFECFGEFWRSEPVLVTNGEHQCVGYWESWEGGEYAPSWKMIGPDGWQISDVTHWMPLPSLPQKGNYEEKQETVG